MSSFSLSSINWRSPVVWFVIIGGGIAVYFLYKHFAGNASSTTGSTSANASGATPYPPTNTYVIEEPPETEPAPVATGTPGNPGVAKQGSPDNIKKPKVITYKALVAAAKKARVSINHEWEMYLSEGYTVTNVPKGVKAPAPDTSTANGFLGPPDVMPVGGGIPNYVHASTWPYGGQMMRPRLG
jgi:hypothetical protein